MTALEIIPQTAATDEQAYLDTHPDIVRAAPRWARQIKFDSIAEDGSADFHYWFDDHRFEVNEHYKYIPGEGVIYGDKQFDSEYDEPEIASKEDHLLELITEYVEREYPERPIERALKITSWDDDDAPIDECHGVMTARPDIAAQAPHWADEVAFVDIFEDKNGGEDIGIVYRREGEKFSISVSANLTPRGVVIDEIPDAVINEDYLDGPIRINQRFLMELLDDHMTKEAK